MPPTSFGYDARLRNTAPEKSRSGENATKKSRSATRPDASSSRGGTGSACRRPAASSRRSRASPRGRRARSRRPPNPCSGSRAAARRRASPARSGRPRPPRARPPRHRSSRAGGRRRGPPHELGEARLLGDVRAALVDRRRRRPAGRRPPSRASRATANWAASGRPILPAPTTATVPAVPGSPTHGATRRAGRGCRVDRQLDRAAEHARRPDGRASMDDRHATASRAASVTARSRRRSAAAPRAARWRWRPPTGRPRRRPSGRPPSRTTPRNASISAASGSAGRDRELGDVALERRRVAADQVGFAVSVARVNVSRCVR